MPDRENNKNIKTVLDIFKNEVDGDVKSALKKLDANYTMTWVYKSPRTKEIFPSTKKAVKKELEEVYHIKSRKYDIKNLAAGKNVVFVEMIESYSDPKTKQKYKTPLILVLEMKNGRIKTGRHYCDPNLSYMKLSDRQIEKIYK